MGTKASNEVTTGGIARERTVPDRQALIGAATRGFSWAMGLARANWLFLFLLAAGAALRAVTLFAYRPALIYPDSIWYLANAENLQPRAVRPIGYPAFLRLLPIENELAVVPLVQHVLGLLVAVLLYAVLVRVGVRRWLAALATAPFLLDAYQLLIEQSILSEPPFELLLVAGCALLLLPRPLGIASAGLAGLVLAVAALTRTVALPVIVPAALTVAFARARPSRGVALLALLAVFALPLAAYAAWFHSVHGEYALTSYGGRFLYARVAPFADCSKLTMPPEERVLCPDQPVGERPTSHAFMWSRRSPVFRVEPARQEELAGKFAKRVIVHQPLAYARAVGSDFVHGFAPTRTTPGRRIPFSDWWQFQPEFPIFREQTTEIIRAHGDVRGYADPQLVSFLRTYQRFAYTPGPLLALGLVVGLLAALGIGRARHSGLRSAAFLFSAVGLVLSLGAAAAVQLSPRYQLPELILLPAALALGLTALTSRADEADPTLIARRHGRRSRGWRPKKSTERPEPRPRANSSAHD